MEASAGEAPAVLLVDDDPDDLLALRVTLEPLGRPLLSANSGEEALRLLLRRKVGLIVMDLRMVGLSGLETAGLIRESPRGSGIPILFLSGFDDEHAREMPGWPSEPVDYLRKPARAE